MKQYTGMQAHMAAAPGKPTFEQWRLLALLVAAVFVNYIDRSNLSVSATEIKQEFHLTGAQLGLASSWFVVKQLALAAEARGIRG